MGTTGPPGNIDLQNLFKSSPQPANTSTVPTPYPNSSHPFNNFSAAFPVPDSHGPSASPLPGPYPFPSHGSKPQPYLPYPNKDLVSGAPEYQAHAFPQPPPSAPPSSSLPLSASYHTRSSSRPSSPSARLLTLLTQQSESNAPKPLELSSSVTQPSTLSSEVALPPAALAPAVPSAPPVNLAPISTSVRLANNKLPRGRYLQGEHVVYDVDVWLPGEAPPQLEVMPISLYTSQPLLLNGRQIAVNRSYICYGLRPNKHIRILNINTASRSVLKGHSERVTDMAFFAEDVHLLASASSDGRVFARRIVEVSDKDNKMQIVDQILLALEFTGDWDSIHPHVCWLSHTQDVLVVGISRDVFMVDIPKVRQSCAPDGFDIEEPVECPVDNLVDGVICILKHDGEVTDISTSLWRVSASASKDGTMRLWSDQHASSPSVLIPHEGHPVGAVAFLSAPHRPDHLVLLSGGPLNQELKLWAPASGEGWLALSGPVNWKCIQTLKLTSSGGGRVEDVFFNQVLVVPRAHVVLLANSKKSALYVIHVDFGPSPSATRLNYLTEFSVVWPILSFTATCENVMDGHGIVQVYCIQTQAIQQYSLELSQCLPPVGGPAIFDSTEKDLANGGQVSSAHGTSKAMAIAVSKAPCETSSHSRPKSPGSLPTSSMGEIMDSKVIGVSTPEGKEASTRDVTVHVSKISAPTPQVGGTPGGSPMAKERIRSPVNEGTSFQVTPPKEKSQYFCYEQSDHWRGRNIESNAPSSSQEGVWDRLSLSPQTHFTGTSRPDEDKELPLHGGNSSSSVSEAQSLAGSSMHLITPLELMSMVAKSKVDRSTNSSPQGTVGLSKEPLKQVSSYEDRMGKRDADAFTIETKEISESAIFNTSNSGLKKVVLLRRGSPEPKVDRNTPVYEYTHMNADAEECLVPQTPFDQDFDSGLAEETHREDETSDAIEGKDCAHELPGEEACKRQDDAVVQVAAALSAASQTRKKKNKNKTDASSSASPSSVVTSAVVATSELDSSRATSDVSSLKLVDQVAAMQDSINQLVAMQRDFQKQIQVILAVPVAREVKRVEAILGQRMEKVLKAHMDAMWARLQEDNAKREKVERDQMQQLSSSLSNVLNKDLPAAVERSLKKELSSLGPSVARAVTPVVEKSVSASVTEACQKGINERGVAQLEKSVGAKVEAMLSKQLQLQFQTSGIHVLQESLRTCLEGSIIPSFEKSCQAMFDQIDAAFQKGLHEPHGEQQMATSVLTASLQEAVTSANSLAASLKGELLDGHRRLLALAESGGASRGAFTINDGLPDKAMTVQHVEESLDPTKELGRLVKERKLEEAFNKALSVADVGVVSWLCNQVDLGSLLTTTPPPLSQGVLLALVSQLGCDLGTNTGTKLEWIKDAALALNPHDPSLPRHVMRLFLEKLYNSLHALLSTNDLSRDHVLSTRLVIHVVNSLLTACN